jgi:hypothetical protein
MAAIEQELLSPSNTSSIHVASGSPGVRAAMLSTWLHGSRQTPVFDSGSSSEFHIGGVVVHLAHETVLKIAREELEKSPAAALRFSTWSVMIDDEMVSPKWLLNIATGIPVSRFSTHTACRVLARLGLDVRAI